MSTIMANIKTVKRGKLLSCDEAGELMGISGNQVRLWIRMRLMHAERIGHVYAVPSEEVAIASERFHKNFLLMPLSGEATQLIGLF